MNFQKIGHLSILAAFVSSLAGCAFDTQTMDLRVIDRSGSPNDALACPPGICRAKSDIESPVFLLAKNNMMERIKAVITTEPRTEVVAGDTGLDQLVFVQHSALLRFPDTVWIQGVKIDRRASIIIYSRSNYGYSDLGVNRNRVRSWLTIIEHALRPDLARRHSND